MSCNNARNTNNPKKRSISDMSDLSISNPKPTKRRKIDEYFEEKKDENSESKHNALYQIFNEEIMNKRIKTASDPSKYPFDETRIRCKQNGGHGIPSKQMKISGVIYWMSRDQRVQDNWAMIYAQKMALQYKVRLIVVFCLQSTFLDATIRHFDFMMKGLQHLENELFELNIPFKLLFGAPKDVIPSFANKNNYNLVITDFSPLRIAKQWLTETGTELEKINIHCSQIDAHNVIPVWITSDKQEYGARTIRSKIHKKLNEYLVEYPPIVHHPFNKEIIIEKTDWNKAKQTLKVDVNIGIITWCKPGTENGMNELYNFITKRLKIFNKDRNIPTKNALSNLSPYYHFGQLSPARAALEVQKYSNKYKESVNGYLEELIIRRELADNFCFYNNNYDKIIGAAQWAQDTLEVHEYDEREYIYNLNELETYKTHDDLWNAAQKQLVIDGKMHGFLRMYWAKKILEWTETAKEALKYAIYLNDKYSIDGRDPNGYVGCMWSICGIHDQGWKERPIFGKIRYMNYAGCKRKFNVDAFVKKMGVSAIKYSKK